MKSIIFHSFRMGDVEDPEIFAAAPIYDWQQTEQGRWVMENCADPQFKIINSDAEWLGYQIVIYGPLSTEKETWWQLKWGHAKA